MIIRKDALRKQVKQKDPRGRVKDSLYFSEVNEETGLDQYKVLIKSCITSELKTTNQILKEAQQEFARAGLEEMKAWHTMKKYLELMEKNGEISSKTVNEKYKVYYRR